MLQDIDLRPLAELEAQERAFLSCYASGADGARSLDALIDRVRRLLADEPAELEHFEASLKLLRTWLGEHPIGDGNVAVFTCGALDLAQGWHIPTRVPSLLRVGSSPYLRPLAELQDEYGTLAVVAADNTSTQIHLVHVDDSRVEGRVRGDVKNAVKKGGWSQKRYARRREKQLERYADEVVEVLADLDRKHGFKRIVMVGSTECLQEIEKRMPQPLRERSHRHDALDPHQGDGAVIEAGWEQWFAVERAEEQQLWEEIRNEALGHGLAALGATEVLGALNASRVAHLLVDREASIKGTRCRACEHVVHGTPETCQACGAAGVFAIDLVDELVRLAELTSAEVEFADPIPALSEEDGVAALLRY